MSRKHSRKRPEESALHRAVRHGFETAQAHPLRLFFFALLNACLVWAVLTKSLPYVLAASAPDSALALNPNNPEALVAKAGRSRERLLSLMEGERKQPNRESGRAIAKPGDTIAALPEAGDETGTDPDTEGERRALRGEIRNLALRAIANDPLNARAYRLLAEVTDNPDNARILMNEALKRSRRETAAIFWLFRSMRTCRHRRCSARKMVAGLRTASAGLRPRSNLCQGLGGCEERFKTAPFSV